MRLVPTAAKTVLCFFLAALASPLPALAERGEHRIDARIFYAPAEGHGLGGGLGYCYGLSDYWNLYTEVDWTGVLAPESDVAHIGHADFGTVYHIDAFEWVPYVRLTTGAYMALRDVDEDAASAAFGMGVGGGLDYRPVRIFGLGLFGAYHVMIVGDVPNHGTVGLRASLYL